MFPIEIMTFLVSITVLAQPFSDKTVFQNSNGFQITTPKCVAVENGDPFYEGPLTGSAEIVLRIARSCHQGDRASDGISIEAEMRMKNKAEMTKAFDRHLAWAKRGEHVAASVIKIDGQNSIRYVDLMTQDRVRWITKIYCPSLRVITIYGPMLKISNPEELKKLKNGKIGIPDFEDEMISSIKCT